ncbi:MAG TPA: fibronectin type III domain-containing protein [Candidatus Gracilibacteria bacterium]
MRGIKKSVAYILCFFFTFQASVTSVGSAQEASGLPGQVQNVIAEEQDGSVFITWNESVDADGEIVGYKVYYANESVDREGDIYDQSVYTPASEPFYIFGDLTPEKDYYFGVTAIDNDGNESDSYSQEVKVSFVGNADMLEAASFSLVKAEHVNPKQVVVEMSDNVVVQSYYNAFVVENVNTGDEMFVGSISTKGKNVYLTVHDDRFLPGQSFRVTASSSVVNQQGTPVSSGITDSAEFTAIDFTNEPVAVEELPDSEPIFEPTVEDPVDYSDLYDQDVVTEAITPVEVYDPIVGPEIEDYDPIEIAEDMIESTDTVAPGDASNLAFDISLLPSEKIVLLFWERNTTDEDVSKQKLYVQKEGSFSREIKELPLEATSFRLPVEEDESYIVGVVTVDDSGNESSGVSVSFGTFLNRVGAATDGIAYFLLICAGAYVVWRRRRA